MLGHLSFRRVSARRDGHGGGALAERAARQVDALAGDGTTTTAFSGLVLGFRWCDRLELAKQVLDRAIAIVQRHGSMLDFANALGLRAEVHVRRGRLREAEADAAPRSRSSWKDGEGPRGVNGLPQSLLAQRRTDEVARMLREDSARHACRRPAEARPDADRARVWASCGEHPRALAEFDEAVRRRQRWGLLVAAECHHALDRATMPPRCWHRPARSPTDGAHRPRGCSSQRRLVIDRSPSAAP